MADLLFLGPLPEPTTGQSLACRVLLDGLRRQRSVEVVDLTKRSFRQGANSPSRLIEIVRAIAHAAVAQRRSGAIYLTISESIAGNLKDLAFYAVAWRRRRHMVVHLHGGAGMRVLLGGRVPGLAAVNRFFLRRLGGVIVLGERLAEMYRPFLPPEKIAIVENFAQDALFRTSDEIAANFADASTLRVLFLSNLLPGKGHVELVEAMEHLSATERGRIELHIAGGFESDADKKAFERTIDGRKEITYHGIVSGNDKIALFDHAHLFCLPTYYPYEGQPISIIEAYASGAAVLTTDHAGIFDIFDPTRQGFAVEPRSPQSIAAALRAALSDRAALHRIAVYNAEMARARFRETQFIAHAIAAIDRLTPFA